MMPHIIPVPAFNDNYIWLLHDSRHAAIVDPGDAAPVIDHLRREGLTPCAVLVTHHHKDHVGGIARLRQAYPDLPVYGPDADPIDALTVRLKDGDEVRLPELGLAFEVLAIPGHTLGHIAFYGHGAVFCGDTLFAGGCGRVFEGNPGMMLASLDRLAALPPETQIYCAHEYTLSNLGFARTVEPNNQELESRWQEAGAQRARQQPTVPSTLRLEWNTNPFLRCREPSVHKAASVMAGRPLETAVEVFAALREAKNHF